MPQRLVAEILEPRARELFEMMRESSAPERHVRTVPRWGRAHRRRIAAARNFRCGGIGAAAVRCGSRWPAPLAKMPSTLAEPEFATVIGMVFYGHRARIARVVCRMAAGIEIEGACW